MREPGLLPRIGALLVVLLSGLGIALSAAAVAAGWVVRPEVTRRTVRACEGTEQLLLVTADSLRDVRAGLTAARRDLESFSDSLREPPPPEPEKQRLRQFFLRQLANQLTPRLENSQRILAGAAVSGVVLSGFLDHFDVVPLAGVGRLDPAKLQGAANNLTELAAAAVRLTRMLDETPDGQSDAAVAAQAARMKEALTLASTRADEVSDWVGTAQPRVVELRNRLPTWITVAAVGVTIFFLWFGAGQLSLLARAWTWIRNNR